MRISDWSSDVCSSDLWAVTLAASIAIDVAAEIVLLQIVRAPEMPRHRPLTREESELSAKVVECNRREAAAYLADVESRAGDGRSEEHTSELQSLMRISYAVFCLKKKKTQDKHKPQTYDHLNYDNRYIAT